MKLRRTKMVPFFGPPGRIMRFACSMGVFHNGESNGATAVLSRNWAWPRVSNCRHLRVVGLRVKTVLSLTKIALSDRST